MKKIPMEPYLKIITLGCKVNQSESEALAAHGESSAAGKPEKGSSGTCVINTCCVTARAAMQSRQAIRKTIRRHPGATIVVTGCYAQMKPDEIRDIAGVDHIVGQADKHRLFDFIRYEHSSGPDDSFSYRVPGNSREETLFTPMPSPAFGQRTRPFLKVQDGCNAFCSYCIVPYSRGRSRSLPPEKALNEMDALIRKGAKEIVVTGIHLGRWGVDLEGGTDLHVLLDTLLSHPAIGRLRLSSLEPAEITRALLDRVENDHRICRHFHIPLQSGDASVLKRMNRHYRPEAFAETIRQIRSRFPDAAIGADVMAGFPGESAAAFENTRKLIESLPITYLHVFPFSPRPPAPAASYPDRVPPEVVRERARILKDTGRQKTAAFYASMTGRVLEVIGETPSDADGFCCKGLSSNYIPVYIHPNEELTSGDAIVNRFVRCRITGSDKWLSVAGMPEDQKYAGDTAVLRQKPVRPDERVVRKHSARSY